MDAGAKKNRKEFNKSAEVFSKWFGTVDRKYMESLCKFMELSADDVLLDVACGSGNFAHFASGKVKSVSGIDISDRQIELANGRISEAGVVNVNFKRADVGQLPFQDNSFSAVISKSAFHHFSNPKRVFAEMYRCCRPGGIICIDDITSYEDEEVTSLIEEMDRLMDTSHSRRLPIEEINALFVDKGMEILKAKTSETMLTVKEYQSHAIQTPVNVRAIDDLVRRTLRRDDMNDYFFAHRGVACFINRGYTVLGRKQL